MNRNLITLFAIIIISFVFISGCTSNFGNSRQIISERDIPYGTHELNKLDIFYKDEFVNAPIIVVVHGGGFVGGDKSEFERFVTQSFINFYIDNGFVVVMPNYRLSPEFEFPTHVNDVACSIAYVQENANKYNADKSKIVLFGNSAGSYIGAMITYNEERDWLEDCDYEGIDFDVLGFIGFVGAYDFDLLPENVQQINVGQFMGDLASSGRWDVAEPINFVSPGDPPALLITGEQDNLAGGPQNTIAFADALEENNVDVELHVIQGYTRHMEPLGNFNRNADMQGWVTNFIERILG